jgi:hypothetical protein
MNLTFFCSLVQESCNLFITGFDRTFKIKTMDSLQAHSNFFIHDKKCLKLWRVFRPNHAEHPICETAYMQMLYFYIVFRACLLLAPNDHNANLGESITFMIFFIFQIDV